MELAVFLFLLFWLPALNDKDSKALKVFGFVVGWGLALILASLVV